MWVAETQGPEPLLAAFQGSQYQEAAVGSRARSQSQARRCGIGEILKQLLALKGWLDFHFI